VISFGSFSFALFWSLIFSFQSGFFYGTFEEDGTQKIEKTRAEGRKWAQKIKRKC